MTCREKFMLDYPTHLNYTHNQIGCPSSYGYLDAPDYCCELSSDTCQRCWDREIPETENIEEVKEMETKTTKKTKTELLNEIADLKKELENLDKYRQYEQVADELAAMRDALMRANFTREEAMQFIFNAQKNIRM